MISRSLYADAWKELADDKAMIFMAGPRQAGKTTLARVLAEGHVNRIYYNWDIITDRNKIIRDPYCFESVTRLDTSAPMVVFDEIHKYKDWKNYLKGVYDGFHQEYRFLVTGSGRLDTYRKGGDSLAGRYALFHIWPFTLAELSDRRVTPDEFVADPLGIVPDHDGVAEDIWRRLSRFSGFPEPYTREKAAFYRRWSSAYHSQIIREDIRDLGGIKSIGEMEMLFSLLPGRVGSLLSIQSLSEDLRVAYNTTRSWLDTLEHFFLAFSILPWARKIARATHKARKTYLFDYAVIENKAARFENMIALELFRVVQFANDLGAGSFDLRFVRNKEKEEVDFLITKDHSPFLLVEAKLSDTEIAPALKKFQRQLGVPAIQLTDTGEGFRKVGNDGQTIVVAPVYLWAPRLP
uniref:Uncharacterized protein n=1 Tax=Candidatus Kentrum sp. FW TaxID=2126338 RepID=A0A450SSM2_9GAMM|nr:MAG: hypothetical protein BECKFW1821B_GA0114236_100451 [Candidatus Kentron sp. FW]VFJ57056.1 MAG: hypothetical protein BECKFW1821A_GA0114235_10674 [Candidatus Kentron sp. FW]